MITRRISRYRGWIIASLIALIAVSTSCKQQPPRPKLSAAEVEALASEFEDVSNTYLTAWNTHDTERMRESFTADAKYFEEGSTVYESNVDAMLDFYDIVFRDNPEIQNYHVATYIARDDGFDVSDAWPANNNMFTKDNPIRNYNWFTLRDGKIAKYWVFWGGETSKTVGISFDMQPLLDYASAWSSNDPQAVAALYAPESIRQDGLFGETQQGSSAVEEFAAKFFAWYPKVRLELHQPFILETTVLNTGGEYSISVLDTAGKPCDVHAIVLLEMAGGKITKESMYYEPDLLVACGWAQ